MNIRRTTEIHVPPFNHRVEAKGSNQKRQYGTFLMQVRRIQISEAFYDHMAEWSWKLGVEGRRYKPDGTLGMLRAYAVIRASELPPELWIAIRDLVPAELHPGGI